MKSAHPDDPAASRALVVMVSGRSIELNALAHRLGAAGASVASLRDGASDVAALAADFVICDLASDGALSKLEEFWLSAPEPRPGLVTLGSARGDLSEGPGSSSIAQARQRYPRPLDIQTISEDDPRGAAPAPSFDTSASEHR